MLKKSIFLLLMVFFIIFSISAQAGIADKFLKKNELLQITELAIQQNIDIKKWSMYIREPVIQYGKIKDIRIKIREIQAAEKGFTWTKEQFKGDHYKIIGKRKNQLSNISEKILIIYFPLHNQYNLSVTYDVKGTGWSKKDWDEISGIYKSKIDNYSVFYTIEGFTKIKGPLMMEAKTLLNRFSGKTVESLNEENFISLSAYTDNWDTKIPLGNEEFMNLHIAYRNSNENSGITKVTIGTPIITSEY